MSQDSVYIIYADDVRRLDGEKLAAHMPGVQIEILDGILKAKDDIQLRPHAPRFIVIDIGERDPGFFEELDMLADVCSPSTRVVVVGAVNDISFYRALLDRGVIEYYAYPLDAAKIADALMREGASRSAEGNASAGAFVAGFMSAASGDGSSTVATNVAYWLANHFNQSVALVDMDYQFGMIARQLDLKAPYGVHELLANPDRGVDGALVNKVIVPYGERLHIIASPAELRILPDVNPEQVVELVSVLRSQFDIVLFDIQHVWVDWIARLVQELDHAVVISQLWLRSLAHVTRMIACWNAMGIDQHNLSLVMNRTGSRFREAMTTEDFERVSGLNIQFNLPNDTKAIVGSENQGKPLAEISDSELAVEMKHIAGHIYSMHTGQPYDKEGESKKNNLFGLFK